MIVDLNFAERAKDAWTGPLGPWENTRAAVRGQYLRWVAPRRHVPKANFIRCLYGHVVFAETAATLRAFVRQCKNEGDFIDTPTLLAMMQAGMPVRGRYFHLSFDDGLANVFEVGGEIFEAERVPYTVFVVTDLVGGDAATIAGYFKNLSAYRRPIRALSWDQVRAMANSSMGEVGCHTRTHARLSAISADPVKLEDEVKGAKTLIEAQTNQPCTSFSWPYGLHSDVDATSFAAIKAAGFNICFSAVRGGIVPGTTDLMSVPRHQVEFHWPMRELTLWAQGYREG